MNLVFAHDYLVPMGGAERVVATMHEAHPTAPIYTSAVARSVLWPELIDADIRTSWMQFLPFIKDQKHFKKYFLLYPFVFRSMKPIEADVAWVSSSTFAKYLRFAPGTRSVGYLHNTTRFLWQTDGYLDFEIKPGLINASIRKLLPSLREIDREAAAGLDVIVSNSVNVKERIRHCYGLDATVVHPPVDTERFALAREEEGFFLIVSRLLGYKNIALAVEVFSKTGRHLVVAGDGPDEKRLRHMAGPSVHFTGRIDDERIADYYGRCRALILPGEEDFGIAPVEAMACGKPVVAFGRGGALESVVAGETGIFFSENTPDALLAAVEECEARSWNPEAIRRHAAGFSKDVFVRKMNAILSPQ